MARLLAIVLVLMLSATGTWADRYDDCFWSFNNSVDRASACTQIIEDGTDESKENRTKAYYYRSTAYAENGDFDSAVADYNESIELSPDTINDEFIPCWRVKTFDGQIRCYTQFIEGVAGWSRERKAHAYLGRGDAYTENRDFDSAVADYNESIELDPKFASAYYQRGLAYYWWSDPFKTQGEPTDDQIAKLDRAAADFTKAIEFGDDDGLDRLDYHRYLYETYARKRDWNRAIPAYNKYIEIYDGPVNHRRPERPICDNPWWDSPRRIRCYTRFIDGAQGWPRALTALIYFRRGKDYDRLGEYKLAIADYTKAIEFDPAREWYEHRAKDYRIVGDYDRAIEDLDKALELAAPFPEDLYRFRLLRERAEVYGMKGEHDRAIEKINFLLGVPRDKPSHADDEYYLRGFVYREKGDFESALADFKKAAEYTPTRFHGPYLALSGEYQKAVDEFDMDIARQPDRAWPYRERGWTYARMGDSAKAKADLAKAKELKPEIWVPKLPPVDPDAQRP